MGTSQSAGQRELSKTHAHRDNAGKMGQERWGNTMSWSKRARGHFVDDTQSTHQHGPKGGEAFQASLQARFSLSYSSFYRAVRMSVGMTAGDCSGAILKLGLKDVCVGSRARQQRDSMAACSRRRRRPDAGCNFAMRASPMDPKK